MTIASFSYQALPAQVRFGRGTISCLADEAARLSLDRLLVLCTPEQQDQAERITELLGGRAAGVFAGAAMHTPVEVTERALQLVRSTQADGVVSVGGGSAVGLGKAIALRTDLPQIAIPTTYAGSEATPILGQTENGLKTTQRTLKVLPELIIYDVDLTMKLPLTMSLTSGFNAIAHAAEALYAIDGNPVIDIMAEQGITALAQALPRIRERIDDADGRTLALYGAWLCGSCLGAVGMALHHKICHTLGGTFDLPHAQTHAIMLPHTLAYNLPAAPRARERLARALESADPARALAELAVLLEMPRALKDVGMPEDGIEKAAELATRNPYANPRPVERDAIEAMLRRAWAGALPAEDGTSVYARI